MPGIPSTARNTNTPARASMMVSPAPRVSPAKILSPRLVEVVEPPSSSGGIGSPAPPVIGLLVVTASSFLTTAIPDGPAGEVPAGPVRDRWCHQGWSAGSASGDLGDDVLRLRGQLGVERSRAGLGGGSLLALVADHVGQVALHQRRRVGVVVGRAGDLVGREQQRVGARVGDRAVDR